METIERSLTELKRDMIARRYAANALEKARPFSSMVVSPSPNKGEWAKLNAGNSGQALPNTSGVEESVRCTFRVQDIEGQTEKTLHCEATRTGIYIGPVERGPVKSEASLLDDQEDNRPAHWRKPRAGKGKMPRSVPLGKGSVVKASMVWTDKDGKSRKLSVWPIDPDIVDRALLVEDPAMIAEVIRGVRQSMNRIIRKRTKVSARIGTGKFGQIFLGIADDCFQSALVNVKLNKIPFFDHEKVRHVARDSARTVIRQATQAQKVPSPYVRINTRTIREESFTDMVGGQRIKIERMVEVEVSKHRTKGLYQPKAMAVYDGSQVGYVPATGQMEREHLRRVLDLCSPEDRAVLVALSRKSIMAVCQEVGSQKRVYKIMERAKALFSRR